VRPRIRTIKPEMWADEKVGRLSQGARLLFVGLITMADDEGRIRELSAAILGHVFPYDEVSPSKVTRWLAEVERSGMVTRYAVGGYRYIAFCHWSKHQKVDRPNESELPGPPDDPSPHGSRTPDDPSTNKRRSVDDASIPTRTGALRSDPDPVVVPVPQDDARALFDHWRERCGHQQAKPTRERLSKIRARLSEGYTADQIRQAIEGAGRAAFTNDTGKRFDDIELVCRNGSKLESFIARATSTVATRPRAGEMSDLDRKRLESANRLMNREGAA
jgi:DNA-binding transcriptional ArsR family regulator